MVFVRATAGSVVPRLALPGLCTSVRFNSTSAASAENVPQPSTPIPIRYPYFVNRVGESQISLPVYRDSRNAGTRSLTLIRKVEGDVSALCRDLFNDFGWGDPFDKANPNADMLVRISQQAGSKKIFLRGNWTRDVKEWLAQRGF